MLDRNTFVVSEKGKMFSSRKTYLVRDENGQELGTAEQSTGFLASLIGMVLGPPSTQVEFRGKDNAPVFTVRRRGLFFKKVEAVDASGKVVALYKAKRFSLKGGFQVYDGEGK